MGAARRGAWAAAVYALALGCALLGAMAGAEALVLQEITPEQTAEVLTNPGQGIYFFGTTDPEEMPPEVWFRDVVAIGYVRDDWAAVQPDGEGEYRFEEYFEPIFDLWVRQWGKRVAFRIMSSNMHSQREYVSPEWVFESGVPSVVHRGLYVDRQVDPVFWDERYLALQERFIADLGKYLDGRPGLEFIDIGCIGEWGEMHLSRWTPEELEATGFTREKYISAHRRIIDAFARAFPNTRVFLNVGDYAEIVDYAALRGLHFRQDGLNPAGPSSNVGKRFYHPYSRAGVICNYEFHSGYAEMQAKGWGLRETFEKGLEDPISYLHINLMWYHELANAPAEVRECILDAARRIGFRFVLERLLLNQTVRVGARTDGRLVLQQTWRNLGVAPCYDSYALFWHLVDRRGRAVASALDFPTRPTTRWWPGEEVSLDRMITIPAGTTPGRYRLHAGMIAPGEPGLQIELGLAGRSPEGYYDLGEIVVERAPDREVVAYTEDFEDGFEGWYAAEGMSISPACETSTGRVSLLATGRQPGGSWNYAATSEPLELLPYSRYRLSCWMRADQIEPANLPPYLKLGVHDAEGNWLTNFNTNRYDLSQPGTWQQLVTYCETSGEAVLGYLAIEKGALELAIRAWICMDDVELTLLASP